MKISITKKGKIVLFVILGIIVLGSGGYLLWRVLQPETVAPEDSEAGGGAGSCCCIDSDNNGKCDDSNCPYSVCPSGLVCKDVGAAKNGTCDDNGVTGCGVCQEANDGCYWSDQMNSTGVENYYGCDGEFFKIDPDSGLCYCTGRYDGENCWEQSAQCKCAETCNSGPVKTCAQTEQCEFPLNAYYDSDAGTCSCVKWDEQSHTYGLGTYCTAEPQQCSFSTTCAAKGMENCGVSGDGKDKTGCSVVDSCDSWCAGCGNLSVFKLYCKESTTENSCEGGNWLNGSAPSGEYEYGNDELKTITVVTDDDDGLGDVTVILNGSPVSSCTTSLGSITATQVGVTCYYKDGENIVLSLDPGIEHVRPGEYDLTISWKDGEGLGGSNCEVSTTFTVTETVEPYCGDGNLDEGEVCDPAAEGSGSQCTNNIGETVDCASDCTCPEADICGDGILVDGEQCELGNPTGYTCTWDTCNQSTCLCEEQQNPDWTISKTGAEQCIEEGEETYAKATYSITVTNVGEGEGSLDKIVDELDDKVLESYLNDISGDGVYDSGTITWDLEGDDEIFSPEESLTLTYYIKVPADSFGIYQNTVTAYPIEGDEFSDDASVNLTCDIPQTGIFDSILIKISLGVILILLGANWSKINYSLNETISNTRIKKFERKVAKEK